MRLDIPPVNEDVFKGADPEDVEKRQSHRDRIDKEILRLAYQLAQTDELHFLIDYIPFEKKVEFIEDWEMEDETARSLEDVDARRGMMSPDEAIKLYANVLADIRSSMEEIFLAKMELPRRGTDLVVEKERTSMNHLVGLLAKAANQAEMLLERNKKRKNET